MPSQEILERAKKINAMREDVSQKKAIYDEANRELKDEELNLIQQMELEEVRNFKLDNIGTFYRYAKPWSRIVDVEKATAFFNTLGIFDEVMQLKPVSKRLNELMKEKYLDNGEPIPENDIGISVQLTPSIGLRRSK